MVNDLQGDYARFVRAVKEISQERTLIILTAICCIITVDNYFRTTRASEAADRADTRSVSIELRFETELQRMALEFDRELRRSDEQWSVSYSELEREYRLTQMEIDNFKITMNKAGLDAGHIGEKP